MKVVRTILSWIYGGALRFRHLLYNVGIKKSFRPETTTICVGNLTVGGTGKTPMVEYLVEQFGRKDVVAVLSRGYGRRTKGYREVQTNDSFRDVGDEPKQIKRKFPRAVVVVCEDRVEGVRRINADHPEVTLIIMDDGFQHRSIRPHVNIILVDYTRPIYKDRLLPRGSLRDLPSQMKRADMVVVTKTPQTMKPVDKLVASKKLHLKPFQELFFTAMVSCQPRAQFPDEAMPMGRNVVLLTGVGNPQSVYDAVKGQFNIVKHYAFSDHHAYRVRELTEIVDELASMPSDTVILTTEKDAVKMTNATKIPDEFRQRLYVMPIKISFPDGNSEDLIRNIYSDVKENRNRS